MRSARSKMLHTIGGRSLLGHAMAAARGVDPAYLVVVVRSDRDAVAAHVAEVDPEAIIADQDAVKGTGRAVECGLGAIPADLAGTVVVTYGDVPLLTSETLGSLVVAHEAAQAAVTVITAVVPDPTGYGRVLRAADGAVEAIVEDKDATPEQLDVAEINSGLYAFDAEVLRTSLGEVGTDNAQGEKYLTDVLAIARSHGRRVMAYQLADVWQTEGVNDKVQLARLGAELNRRTVERAMRDGAIIRDPATTWIDATVSIGQDTVVQPNTQLLGATTIGAEAVIGPDTTLTDMEVGDGATVCRTHGSLSVDRPGGNRRAVGLSAAGHRARRRGQDRDVRRDQELHHRRRRQGAAPVLCRRRDDRGRHQHRRRLGVRQLRRNRQAPHRRRQALPDGQRQHVRRAGDRRRRRLLGSGHDRAVRHPAGALSISVAPQRNLLGWVVANRPDTAAAKAAEASQRHTDGDDGTGGA